MGSVVELRADYSAAALRQLSRTCGDVNQSRCLLSLATVLDNMSRTDAARFGGMDRRTVRILLHRFSQLVPDGLKDCWYEGPHSRLTAEQKTELAELVEIGPDSAVQDVVRWARVDLQKVNGIGFASTIMSAPLASCSRNLGCKSDCRI